MAAPILIIEKLLTETLSIHIIGSIAFDSMDQDSLNEWYDKATLILATEVLGCEPEVLRNEVEAMIERDDRWRQPR